MARFLFASVLLLIGLFPAAHVRAQACDPWSLTVTQQLFPDASVAIPYYVLIRSSGCTPPAAPVPVSCLAKTILPASAGTDPATALSNKCAQIVAAIQTSCPTFSVSNIDCDATPNQMTQFTITDAACVGAPAAPGKGLAVMAANEATALTSFNPAGTLLPDYELDTVIPNCNEPAKAKNMMVMSGSGGSGTTIFPGGASAFEVRVTTHQSGTITHTEPTTVGGNPVSPEAMASAQAAALNETFLALGDDTVCTASGRILQCDDSNGGALALDSLDHATPVVGAVSNDPAMPFARIAGSSDVVNEMKNAVQNGGCENLETDCAALVPEPGATSMLACGGALLAVLQRRRMRSRE